MLERVKEKIRGMLAPRGPDLPVGPEQYARRYEYADAEGITAVIAGKLAALVFADSTVEVLGNGERPEAVRRAVQQLWDDGNAIVSQALGKGGKLLLPVVRGERISVHAVDQSRMVIHRMEGGRLMHVSVLMDKREHGRFQRYLLADYEMDGDGVQHIRCRACDGEGAETALTDVPDWADVTGEFTVQNTDRLLLGFMRCPRDNRAEQQGHGVPITYGAEADVAELVEHMKVYRREFRLSRMMLGLDSALWRDPFGAPQAADISTLRRTVQDGEDPFIPWDSPTLEGRSAWQVYAPQIRHEAMEARYRSLCRRIETDIGLSCGILTERQRISYANRDEIRAAMYDTFCVVKAVRDQFTRALQDVAYAVGVLADASGIAPSGDWQLRLDWDYGLVESTEQTFRQNMALHERSLMTGAELRQWALGGTLREAEEAVALIGLEEEKEG